MVSSLRDIYILNIVPVGNPLIGALLNLESIQPGLILSAQLNLVLYLTGPENHKTPPLYLRNGVFVSIARPLCLWLRRIS